MKNLRINFISIILLLAVGLSFSANPVAVVIKSKGSISVKKADSKIDSKIKRGYRLESGDQVVTGKDGYIAIKFIDDASLVRIRPNSTCVINTTKEDAGIAKNIFVEVGTIFSKITSQKASYRVSTPTSVASVKGTIFWTVQEFKGGTFYFGEDGVVELSNEKGSALLREGETGYVSSLNAKPIVRKTKPGEKPQLDDDEESIDEFEFEFQNEQGQRKTLKFKAKKIK